MAKTINCTNISPEGEACNECVSCQSFNSSASFNIHELDAASNNSVEDIRNLVEQVRVPPQEGKYKIYIIDEVHMLSQAAFNAFLKTLEEPPAYAKFILATTERHKIIPTILSRCQIYNFKRISVEDIAGHLAYVASSEGITAESDALHIIAQKADGALRDALSLFDQMVTFSGTEITYHSVIENLNILDYDNYFQFVDFFMRSDYRSALILLNEITGNGFDGQHIITGMSNHIRNLLVARDPATISLLEMGEQLSKRYTDQASATDEAFLSKALDMLTQSEFDYRQSNVKSLMLENLVLQLSLILQKRAEEFELKKKIAESEHEASNVSEPSGPGYQRTNSKKEEEEKVKTQALRRISIAERKSELGNSEKPEAQHEAFDNKKLIEVWAQYCKSIQVSKINLYNILIHSSISKIDDTTMKVVVDGPMKKAEVESERAEILQEMRRLIKNDGLMLETVQIDKTESKDETGLQNNVLKTTIEKYPALSYFVETLNLNAEI
jgi:DNA polymerase-3 subunit gamma/tau